MPEMMDAKLRIMLADAALWMWRLSKNCRPLVVSWIIRLPVSSNLTIIFLTQIGAISTFPYQFHNGSNNM
jgi:hypothetical protein